MGETEGEGGTAATSGLFFFKHIFQPHVLISAVLCCDTFLCPFLLVFSIICSCRFVKKNKMNYFPFTVLVLDLTGEALWYARLKKIG